VERQWLSRFCKTQKNDRIRSFLSELRTDIAALSELNRPWKNLPEADRLAFRTMGWFKDCHRSTAYYAAYADLFLDLQWQPGGVSVWAINKAATFSPESGSDPKGLGRWTWTRLTGCNGMHLRVISAYRPIYKTSGELTIYMQQQAYF
jgi:hypothetical protein